MSTETAPCWHQIDTNDPESMAHLHVMFSVLSKYKINSIISVYRWLLSYVYSPSKRHEYASLQSFRL